MPIRQTESGSPPQVSEELRLLGQVLGVVRETLGGTAMPDGVRKVLTQQEEALGVESGLLSKYSLQQYVRGSPYRAMTADPFWPARNMIVYADQGDAEGVKASAKLLAGAYEFAGQWQNQASAKKSFTELASDATQMAADPQPFITATQEVLVKLRQKRTEQLPQPK
jgi:hypothetical protein